MSGKIDHGRSSCRKMLDGFETGGLRVPRETRDLKINERKVGKEKRGNNDEEMGAKSRKMERQ